MNLYRRRLLALLAAAAPLLARSARAQGPEWPQRLVRLILPFGPGSGLDITARMFSDPLAARWGKPLVIDNRPGGDGIVAINALLNANDDHTLLYAAVGSFTVHPYLHDKLPYDARDLVPIVKIAETMVSYSVPTSLNVHSLKELMALARAQPGKLNYATAAGISQFVLDGYFKSAGLEVTAVPYRDITKAPSDLGEGRIQLLATSLAMAQTSDQTGKTKVIAVANRLRSPAAADIPTVTEAGFPELAFDAPTGLFGPRGMAPDVRERIAADVRAVMAANPNIVARMAAIGQVVDTEGPEEFAASIARQRARVAEVAATLGLKPKQ
jgi:tripartite-type tricarboxylate transporter receptor subunit TctC